MTTPFLKVGGKTEVADLWTWESLYNVYVYDVCLPFNGWE